MMIVIMIRFSFTMAKNEILQKNNCFFLETFIWLKPCQLICQNAKSNKIFLKKLLDCRLFVWGTKGKRLKHQSFVRVRWNPWQTSVHLTKDHISNSSVILSISYVHHGHNCFLTCFLSLVTVITGMNEIHEIGTTS